MVNDMSWLASLGNEDDAIQKAINMLRSTASNAERKEDVQAAESIARLASTAALSYATLQSRLKRMTDQLNALQSLVDRNVSDFCDSLALYVDSDKAAINAQQIYDIRWFQTLPYSTIGKIAIAARLIAAVSVYDTTYVLPLWLRIVQYDKDALQTIALKAETSKITGLSFYSPADNSAISL